ncbi:MAG: WG repeat-containing protein [Bacteroidetes bacterium]|nr:WG repeat-containing protein [Bacteroidota bacterium]
MTEKALRYAELVSASPDITRRFRNKFGTTKEPPSRYAELVSASPDLTRGFRNKFGMTETASPNKIPQQVRYDEENGCYAVLNKASPQTIMKYLNKFAITILIAISLMSVTNTNAQSNKIISDKRLEKRECDNGKWGFRDSKKQYIECLYDDVDDLNSYYSSPYAYAVKIDNKWSFIDTTGKILQFSEIKNEFKGLGRFIQFGLIGVQNDINKWGFIDTTGALVIPFKYNDTKEFCSKLGMCAVMNNEKEWGFIDTTGTLVIPYQFKSIHYFYNSFSDEMCAVMNNKGKWGFIDVKGKLVIPYQYDSGAYFKDGIASVSKDGKSFLINKKGKRIKK